MLRLAWIILAIPAILAGPQVVNSSANEKTTVAPSTTPKGIDCTGRSDGFYVTGCNQNFTQCHDGTAYHKWCPVHLFFSSRLARCEDKTEINECKNPRAVENQIFASPPEFTCVNRTDGFYSHPSIPCDKSYYVCIAGNVMRAACGYQQYFDVRANRCDYRGRVNACKGIKISGAYAAQPAPLPAQDQPLIESTTPNPPPVIINGGVQVLPFISDVDGPPKCEEDGVFADSKQQCVNFFWKCANERLFKYQCPNVLFYDPEVNRCDMKENIPICGGVRQVTVAPPAFDPTPIDFDCTGKEDGIYQKESCSKTFYTCLSGTPRRQECNAGLVYDLRVKYCDYPLACSKDRVTTTPPPPAELNNIIQADATQPPVNFDCTGKADGHYTMGKCKNAYATCVHGLARLQKCHAPLVFDGEQCNFESNCLNPSTTQAPLPPQDMPANPYSQQVQPQPPRPTTTKAPIPPPTLPPRVPAQAQISCAGLENGDNAAGVCSPNYVSCWGGQATAMSCSNGLVFNPYKKYCDFSASIPECNGGAAQSPPQIVPTSGPSPPAIPPYQPQPLPAQDSSSELKRCSHLPDGLYADGCSENFFNCVHGRALKMRCPFGLFFNKDKESCDVKAVIPACGGMAPTTTLAPLAPLPNAIGNDQPVLSSGYGVSQDESQVVGNQCTERSVSNSGCNTFYFRCQLGRIERVQCAPGMYYNIAKHLCASPEQIPACGGNDLSLDVTVAPTLGPVPQQTGEDTFCVGKETGYYGIGCHTFGYACVAGGTFKFNCPVGTFFNDDNKKCEWKERVTACGGTPLTTTPEPSISIQPVIDGGAASDTPVGPIQPFCERLADGYYADGCNSYFYYCRNGETQRLYCPTGTFYNAKKQTCHRRENVPNCQASQTLPQSPASPPGYQSVQPVQPLPQAPPSKPIFDCSRQADGLYSPNSICSEIFIQCFNGATVQNKCQKGLFFNLDNGMCDYQERVPACGGSTAITTTTTTQVPPVAQSPATARPYPAIQVSADTPFDASCSGKTDGYYADGCSHRYYSCQSGNLIAHKCQPNLRFDEERTLCDFPDQVKICGASPAADQLLPTSATPVPAIGVFKVRPAPPFDCKGKEDGLYPLFQCGGHYAHCSNGNSYVSACDVGHKFNKVVRACDYPSNIVECGGAPLATTTTQAPMTLPATLPARDQGSSFCSSKLNGFYPTSECSGDFIKCSNSLDFPYKCPAGLIFSKDNLYCDFPMLISGCPDYVAPTSQPIQPIPVQTLPQQPLTPIQPIAPQQDQSAISPYPQNQAPLPTQAPYSGQTLPQSPPAAFSCDGKPDGIYGATCATQYWKCSNGVLFTQNCMARMVFDGVSGGCDYSIKVQGCQ